MKYIYGTNDSYAVLKGKEVSAEEMADIIKRDVGVGKWNIYEGGETNSRTATCRYKRNGYIYHSHLLIYGNKQEFLELEEIIKDFIEVVPRAFT